MMTDLVQVGQVDGGQRDPSAFATLGHHRTPRIHHLRSD